MIRTAARSIAKLCIVPMQDLLHLGSEARMNTPAKQHGKLELANAAGALDPAICRQLPS